MDSDPVFQPKPETQIQKPIFKGPTAQLQHLHKIILSILLIIIITVVILFFKANGNKNISVSQQQTIITATIVSPTINVPNSQSIKTSTSSGKIKILTCENVQEEYNSNNMHDFDVAFEKSKLPYKCKIINKTTRYSLIFDEGWSVHAYGSPSSDALTYSDDNEISSTKKQLKTVFISSLQTADDSPFDINHPESIIITGEGLAHYIDLNSKIIEILDKKIENIGDKQVLEMTTTVNNNLPKNGDTWAYEKKFVILRNSNKTIYEFTIHSYDQNFQNMDSVSMINKVKEMISSFEFI